MTQDLIEEIEERKKELIEEYGSYEDYYIEINELLRDEFNDDKYEQALIEVGVNDSEDDLGLQTESYEDTIEGKPDDEKTNIITTLLRNNKRVYGLYMSLMGYEVGLDGKHNYSGKQLLPKSDIEFMIEIVGSYYQPQSLSSKLQNKLVDFEDHINSMLHQFRKRLASYPDRICSAREMRVAIDLFLNEIVIIRNAIASGRIGDLTRDISNNSYTEKNDIAGDQDKIDSLKKKLGL